MPIARAIHVLVLGEVSVSSLDKMGARVVSGKTFVVNNLPGQTAPQLPSIFFTGLLLAMNLMAGRRHPIPHTSRSPITLSTATPDLLSSKSRGDPHAHQPIAGQYSPLIRHQ